MHDETILMILRYLDVSLPEPDKNMSRDEFIQRSYSRWAAYEIIDLLMDRPFTAVADVIFDFILRMCYYAHMKGANDDGRCEIAIRLAEELEEVLTRKENCSE